MYKKIIVPLDGSETGERSLAYAQHLAKAFGSKILAIQVVIPQVTGTAEGTKVANVYLERTIAPLREQGFDVAWKAAASHVAALRIAAEADDSPKGLVCMSTHGLTGVRRWILGNIANEVIKSTRSPVLIVPQAEGKRTDAERTHMETIIAPLDGTPSAEQALPHIETMATTFGLPIHLIYVQGASKARQAQQDMNGYLQGVAQRIRANVGTESQVHVLYGDNAADAIVNHASSLPSYLIVMTTHSRIGFQEKLLGTMADRLSRRAEGPILFIHPNSEW